MHLTKSCMICESKEPTRHIELYIVGSEGLDVCHACEMIIVGYIRTLKGVNDMARMHGYRLAIKKQGKNNARQESEEN